MKINTNEQSNARAHQDVTNPSISAQQFTENSPSSCNPACTNDSNSFSPLSTVKTYAVEVGLESTQATALENAAKLIYGAIAAF